MNRERTALTLMELITVLAIIALLAGILIPTLSAVKNYAREAKQKAQFSTIGLALTAFKNDYGDYPPSYYTFPPLLPTGIYCGAQKLTEALLGLDLLGFHPNSAWRWDGLDSTGTNLYDSAGDLSARKGPYLEEGTKDAFKLRDLFGSALPTTDGIDTYVLCDVFGATPVPVPGGKRVKAGAPILYYRADSSGKFNDAALAPTPLNNQGNIYNYNDNYTIVWVKETVDGKNHPLDDLSGGSFYDYITDPKITARPWPYRPDSYILISAGADGLYGTGDDIRNFGY